MGSSSAQGGNYLCDSTSCSYNHQKVTDWLLIILSTEGGVYKLNFDPQWPFMMWQLERILIFGKGNFPAEAQSFRYGFTCMEIVD